MDELDDAVEAAVGEAVLDHDDALAEFLFSGVAACCGFACVLKVLHLHQRLLQLE
jgi:hypothetical protein